MKSVSYNVGGKDGENIELTESDKLVAVRTHKESLKESLSTDESKEVVKKFKVKQKLPRANVTVLEVKNTEGAPLEVRDEARTILKKEDDVRFAGRVLVDKTSQEPVLYTENIYVKFRDQVSKEECENILKEYNLSIKQVIPYDTNAYFVEAPEGTGLKVFDICNELLAKTQVELCEPELIRKKDKKDFLLPKKPKIHEKQWHLKKTVFKKRIVNAHSSIKKAHSITLGEGITIAVMDDGVDLTHPEFNLPGKIVAPYNADDKSDDPSPFYEDDNHGTACAGVACASGQYLAAGVAPASRLMPIRCEAELGSQEEADCIFHAVQHGADIISCSWGPEDGDWCKPKAKLHRQQHILPERIRKVINYAVTKGRNGKGCVVLFAAGNGRESADLDGYISNPDVIAVAACNDSGRRCVYSDFGKAVWVCFPSGDSEWGPYKHPKPLTTGIWTTDRTGIIGYKRTGYLNDFDGTSSACPGVAGVCALILSANPDLTSVQVKNILKETADKIDPKGGEYNSDGHSIYYGYGRVNAYKAVTMAVSLKK